MWRVALGLLLLPRLSREFIANEARDGESERKMQGHNDPVPSGVASARAAQKGVRAPPALADQNRFRGPEGEPPPLATSALSAISRRRSTRNTHETARV